jgi:hypothetical protein
MNKMNKTMTDLPERARELAKQFITEQNETYSPETREEEEAELSKLADLILAELQAVREAERAWVDKLYDVRAEPDKLLIMITNKHYEVHRTLKERKDADTE